MRRKGKPRRIPARRTPAKGTPPVCPAPARKLTPKETEALRRERSRKSLAYAEQFLAQLRRRMPAVRAARGVSKERLVRDSGVARSTLYQIEGGVCFPSLLVTCRLAYAQGLTVTDFIARLEFGGG